MWVSSLVGVSRWVWMGRALFMMRALASRYQKKVEVGWRVMAWRMPGTRDQLDGELLMGYWSLVGKKVR
jgi:hypothetical protein